MSLRIIALLLMLVAPVAAFDVSPQNPTPGEDVIITGTASPGEDVRIRSSFDMDIPVEDGKYEYVAYGIEVPQKPNRLSVVARNVETLIAGVKMGIWITMPVTTRGGVASVSKSDVPPGRYTLKMFGDAVPGASTVSITVDAETTVTSDSSGEYELVMDTSGAPEGEYRIWVGSEEKVVNIGGSQAEPSRSEPSGAGSGGSILDSGTGSDEDRAPPVSIPDPYYRVMKKADADNTDEIVRYVSTARNLAADLDVFEKAAFYEHYLAGHGFNVSFAYAANFNDLGRDHIWLLVTTKNGDVIDVDPSYSEVGAASLLPLEPAYSRYDQRFDDVYDAAEGLGAERLAWWTDETAWGSVAQRDAVEDVNVSSEPVEEKSVEDDGLISKILGYLKW